MNPLPEVLDRAVGAEARFLLHLDPELAAFRGHFPGDPLVPGVVQLDWAIRLGVEAFGPLGTFRGLGRVKFLAPLRPGANPELHLSRGANGALAFRYTVDAVVISSGSVLFGVTP